MSVDSPIITSKRELIEDIAAGEKSRDDWGIGTEHEKFIFDASSFRRLPYRDSGGAGIFDLLKRLQVLDYWSAVYEGENIIALQGRSGDSVTLEPGGQFELSGAILSDIHATCQEASRHLHQVHNICEELGAFALGLGFDPVSRREDVSWMPKGRYQIMRNYMPKVGSMGLDMMLRTCTVQVNLDFCSEADMIDKMRIALALQPLATALFANSPFCEGRPTGYVSYRSLAWFHTDSARCGMLPFVFSDDFGYEAWVDYLLDVPMYFFYRDGVYHDVAGLSFRDFMSGGLSGHLGLRATLEDWHSHMTTVFPEVRLKRFIEMRGADGGSGDNLCALPAFWVGLLYDSEALSSVRALIADWTVEEITDLRSSVPRYGLRAGFRGGCLGDIAEDVLAIAELGLRNRGREDSLGADETIYLSSLKGLVSSGETVAERHLRDLEAKYGGDLHALMRAHIY